MNPWVALAVIMDQAGSRRELALNELLNSPKNIGRVFNLDSINMLNVLYEIEKIGALKINRTAGLDVINLLTNYTFQDCVNKYYESINEQNQEN